MKKIETSIGDFLNFCQFEKNLRPKTLKAYKTDLYQFVAYIKHNDFTDNICELNKEMLKEYLQVLSKYKPKTIKRKVATLRAFLNELEFEEVISINPFRKMRVKIKEPYKLPNVMNSMEIETFLKAIWDCKLLYNNKPKYNQILRDIAVSEMLFATGMRVCELCDLTNDNFNLNTGLIKIVGKGDKERLLYVLDDEVLMALKDYYKTFEYPIIHSGFFFVNRYNTRLSEQSVRSMIKNYVKLSGLSKNITPHTFRHSFATLLLEEDVDIKYIQNFLGHSSIATTQIYTHVNSEKKIGILRMKHPRKNFRLVNI